MEENIEVKDVQKTEYLDKTGLDMLWTKVKENTHNQVEVEYNRAKAKEDSLSQEIASVKPAEGKVFLQVEDETPTKVLKDGSLRFGDSSTQVFSLASGNGFFAYDASDGTGAKTVDVSPNGIESDPNRKSDTNVWNTNGGITDLTSYALNSDVTEKIAAKADATALTALEEKVTANATAIEGKQDKGNYITYTDYSDSDGYTTDKSIKFDGKVFNTVIRSNLIIIEANRGNSTSSLSSNKVNFVEGGQKTEYSYKGIESYQYRNCLATSDGTFKPISDFVLKTDSPTAATKESLGVVKVGDGLNVADGTVSVDPEYITEHFIDMMSYGVEWDTTISDPACTRIGNPLLHKSLPIQSEYKGCLVKNGKVNYYLDPNDWSKKADGTPSVLDGTDGDVMVHIPKFYGKSGSNGTKRWVRIATTKIDPSWVEIPEMFVSAYKVTLHKDTDSNKAKVASVVNTTANYRGGSNRADYDKYLSTDKFRTDLGKPITNISRAQMRTNASNFGQELLCYEFYKWVFYWAYVIEYANFDSQKEFNSNLTSDGYHQGGLGKGVTILDYNHSLNYNNCNPLTPCGYTNEFGNFSGVKQMVIPAVETDDGITIGDDATLYANRWRGFENPFGDIFTILDGIIVNIESHSSDSRVYTTSDSSKFGDDESVMSIAVSQIPDRRGYIKEFDLGETGEIIPKLVNGSESTYKCDYYWRISDTGKFTLRIGGSAIDSDKSGFGYSSFDLSFNTYNSSAGFRSVIRA